MSDFFVRKLRHGASLSEDDERTLRTLCVNIDKFDAQSDVTIEGDAPKTIKLVLEGWACRYKLLENGKRQIISLFLPGDMCEPYMTLPQFMDHSLGVLTPATVARVAPEVIKAAARERPQIEKALWWDLLLAMAMGRESVVTLGRRLASERLGHLFCELHLRLEKVGLVDGLGYEMPLTQSNLGDLLGMSTVHVNRSLQELRAAGLVTMHGRRVTILDLEGLRSTSLFDPAYLQSYTQA
ncbi:Crp/Fnr family transcriptional regulator [Tianweitania sp.]|uniref:Crp/Fnr family transcriptional regulator n=1 Tax=Tianweitania sp. TaxID=2021634 RepID=UPI00289A42D8|nr:Crp/Fnr family transcriptional regulator [Tianweitania sp.]